MNFKEYFKCYVTLCEHFERISKNINFEILKKVDIFNDGNNTQVEIDEIKKIIQLIKREKTFFASEVKKYNDAYNIPTSGFNYGRNVVEFIYYNEPFFNYLIDIFEGILEIINNNYHVRKIFLESCCFEHFVLLKNCYISNLECLQDIIKFLNEVIKPNMNSSTNRFNAINYKVKDIDDLLKKYMKNLLIEENHKNILSVLDKDFKDNVKTFFNDQLIVKMKHNNVDTNIINIIENKYINLLLIKSSFEARMYNFIMFFHWNKKEIPTIDDIYKELFDLHSYRLKIDPDEQNGNSVLFEEFLYSVTSIFNNLFDKVDLGKVFSENINILNYQSILTNSPFIKSQYIIIYNIIPFIDNEIAYFNEIPAYVSANQTLFPELQLTDYRTQQKKNYNYIVYIQEQFNLIRYIFVSMMNILYTLTTVTYNVIEEYRTNFLRALFNGLFYTI